VLQQTSPATRFPDCQRDSRSACEGAVLLFTSSSVLVLLTPISWRLVFIMRYLSSECACTTNWTARKCLLLSQCLFMLICITWMYSYLRLCSELLLLLSIVSILFLSASIVQDPSTIGRWGFIEHVKSLRQCFAIQVFTKAHERRRRLFSLVRHQQ
jgi:hypothetical protein